MTVPGTVGNPLYVKDDTTSGPLLVDTGAADGYLTGQGRKTSTTPGTAVALSTTQACKWVTVTAFSTNTDRVHIGVTGVVATSGSQTGIGLAPGEKITVPILNVSSVFMDVRVSGEGVAYAYGA